MGEVSKAYISNHLSEMVETALDDLKGSKCVAAGGDEDMALGALNLGIIASHYYIRHAAVVLFASLMTPRTKVRGLLDILAQAAEFSTLPVRIGEEQVMKRLAMHVPVPLTGDDGGTPSYSSPHFKAHLLIQSHLSRRFVAGELIDNRTRIASQAVRLLRAMVDVISSAGWLKPALAAVELSQMVVQAMWLSGRESPLLQLPHMENSMVSILENECEVNDIFDFMNMEPGARLRALQGLTNAQVRDVALACKSFPNIADIEIQALGQFVDTDGTPSVKLKIGLERILDDEDGGDDTNEASTGTVPMVSAPRFSESKEEGWWLVVDDVKSNSLLTVKHVALKQRASVKLKFIEPESPGKHNLKPYLLSDSYVDCDQAEDFVVTVAALESESDGEAEGDGADAEVMENGN